MEHFKEETPMAAICMALPNQKDGGKTSKGLFNGCYQSDRLMDTSL